MAPSRPERTDERVSSTGNVRQDLRNWPAWRRYIKGAGQRLLQRFHKLLKYGEFPFLLFPEPAPQPPPSLRLTGLGLGLGAAEGPSTTRPYSLWDTISLLVLIHQRVVSCLIRGPKRLQRQESGYLGDVWSQLEERSLRANRWAVGLRRVCQQPGRELCTGHVKTRGRRVAMAGPGPVRGSGTRSQTRLLPPGCSDQGLTGGNHIKAKHSAGEGGAKGGWAEEQPGPGWRGGRQAVDRGCRVCGATCGPGGQTGELHGALSSAERQLGSSMATKPVTAQPWAESPTLDRLYNQCVCPVRWLRLPTKDIIHTPVTTHWPVADTDTTKHRISAFVTRRAVWEGLQTTDPRHFQSHLSGGFEAPLVPGSVARGRPGHGAQR